MLKKVHDASDKGRRLLSDMTTGIAWEGDWEMGRAEGWGRMNMLEIQILKLGRRIFGEVLVVLFRWREFLPTGER